MFSDIHPSPTAGSGRLRPRRTTYGPNDAVQEMGECAQCGFPIRVGVDQEGDSADAPTITQVPQTVTVEADNSKLPQPLKDMAAFQNGATVTITSDQVEGSGGCRFCHSLNWKGNGRTQDPFAKSRASMEGR